MYTQKQLNLDLIHVVVTCRLATCLDTALAGLLVYSMHIQKTLGHVAAVITDCMYKSLCVYTSVRYSG